MRITVNVTQKDINEGVRRNCEKCPIARAIERKLKRPVRVSTTGVFDGVRRYWLHHKAMLFVGAFDRGEPVKPFRFPLEVVK